MKAATIPPQSDPARMALLWDVVQHFLTDVEAATTLREARDAATMALFELEGIVVER